MNSVIASGQSFDELPVLSSPVLQEIQVDEFSPENSTIDSVFKAVRSCFSSVGKLFSSALHSRDSGQPNPLEGSVDDVNAKSEKTLKRNYLTQKLFYNTFDGELVSKVRKSELVRPDVIQLALCRINRSIKSEKRHNLMVAEMLSKYLAYCEDYHEKSIEIPTWVDGKSVMVEYKMQPCSLRPGNILWVLEPKDPSQGHPPIVTIRGTSLSESLGPLYVDLNVSSVGQLFTDGMFGVGNHILYNHGRVLHDLLKGLNEKYGAKSLLMGHSLGGTLSQRLALRNKNYSFIEKIYSFNSPGILDRDCKTWSDLLDEGAVEPDFCQVVGTKGDPIEWIKSSNFIGNKITLDPIQIPMSTRKRHGNAVTMVESRIKETYRNNGRLNTPGRVVRRILLGMGVENEGMISAASKVAHVISEFVFAVVKIPFIFLTTLVSLVVFEGIARFFFIFNPDYNEHVVALDDYSEKQGFHDKTAIEHVPVIKNLISPMIVFFESLKAEFEARLANS